jgi:protein involved in polysaccharide export with SLBB domain
MFLMAGILFAGCKSGNQDKAFAGMKGAATSPPNSKSEILRAGDAITIIYQDVPVPLPNFDGRIKDDGTITLVQSQPFTAAGKTPGELEKEIRERYVPKIYKYMTVTVNQSGGSRFYYVGGEVKSPASHQYIVKLTVLQAIQSSGDFTEYASKGKVRLIHQDGRTEIVNCKKAIKVPRLDLEVLPDDKVYVPRKLW